MTIKVYVSGLSGNYEVKKRQQRIQTVLDSCVIKYELIDITEAGREDDRKFMQETAKGREGERNPLPPQIYNDQEYCGDYDGFDFSNETDQLYQFLKLSEGEVTTAQNILSANRKSASREPSPVRENGVDAAGDEAKTVVDVPAVPETEEKATESGDAAETNPAVPEQESSEKDEVVTGESPKAVEDKAEAHEPALEEAAATLSAEPVNEHDTEEASEEDESKEEESDDDNSDMTDIKAIAQRLPLEDEVDFWGTAMKTEPIEKAGEAEDSGANFWDEIGAEEDTPRKAVDADKEDADDTMNFWDDITVEEGTARKAVDDERYPDDAVHGLDELEKQDDVAQENVDGAGTDEDDAVNFLDSIGQGDAAKKDVGGAGAGADEDGADDALNFWDDIGKQDDVAQKDVGGAEARADETVADDAVNVWDDMGKEDAAQKNAAAISDTVADDTDADREVNFWDDLEKQGDAPQKSTGAAEMVSDGGETDEAAGGNFWDEIEKEVNAPQKSTDAAEVISGDVEDEDTGGNFWDDIGEQDNFPRKRVDALTTPADDDGADANAGINSEDDIEKDDAAQKGIDTRGDVTAGEVGVDSDVNFSDEIGKEADEQEGAAEVETDSEPEGSDPDTAVNTSSGFPAESNVGQDDADAVKIGTDAIETDMDTALHMSEESAVQGSLDAAKTDTNAGVTDTDEAVSFWDDIGEENDGMLGMPRNVADVGEDVGSPQTKNSDQDTEISKEDALVGGSDGVSNHEERGDTKPADAHDETDTGVNFWENVEGKADTSKTDSIDAQKDATAHADESNGDEPMHFGDDTEREADATDQKEVVGDSGDYGHAEPKDMENKEPDADGKSENVSCSLAATPGSVEEEKDTTPEDLKKEETAHEVGSGDNEPENPEKED